MQKLTRTQKLTRMAMLAAVTIVLALTPIGYVRWGPSLEITLMTVPVALGGLTLGWPAGAFLGVIFGLSSFIKAFSDPLGQIMLAQNAVLAFLGCVLPRLAVGLLADLFHKIIVAKAKLRRIWFYAVAGAACSLCNTILFLGFIWAVFDTAVTGITLSLIMSLVGFNGMVEMGICAAFVALLGRVLLAPPPDDGKRAEKPTENPKKK